jgi:RNA polymerase sigma factor (sigma-70 family)
MTEKKHSFLEELVTQHGPALQRFLTRKLRSPEEAADVAQETYLRLHKLEDLGKLTNARAFMFQTAANMAVDQLRRTILHEKYVEFEVHKEPRQNNSSPDRILNAEEQLQHIYQTIEGLPLKCRQAFLLHRKSGMSYSAIAEEMSISVSSVEKYILQALKECRKARSTI